jgi:hypothetical protein
MFSKIPTELLSTPLRGLIDKTAILTRNKDAMLSSVLNLVKPRKTKGSSMSSILPFLAREYPHEPSVEALVRPRLPVLRPRQADDGDFGPSEDDEGLMMENARYTNQTQARHEIAAPKPMTAEEPAVLSIGTPTLPPIQRPVGTNPADRQVVLAQLPSPKRGRWHHEASTTSTNSEPNAKRVHLAEQETFPASSVPNLADHMVLPAVREVLGSAVTTNVGEESDDSFEMPTINPDLDTDEEEEEEEDEGGDEGDEGDEGDAGDEGDED